MIELSTERLLLRMLRPSDLDAYAAMLGDPEIVRYIGDGQPASRNDCWRHIALMLGHWQLRGYGMWAIELREDGQMLGRVGFWNPEGWPGLEIGWMLRGEFWGHGYVTEAARACLDYGFNSFGFPRVISLIRENIRSIRVAERLGEKLEGEIALMERPALVYAISREQWTGGAIGSWDERRFR